MRWFGEHRRFGGHGWGRLGRGESGSATIPLRREVACRDGTREENMIPDLLDSMPWSIHGAVALALVAGLVVWIFGRRLFRPMLVLAGVVFAAGGGGAVWGGGGGGVRGGGGGWGGGAAIPHEWSILWPVGIGAVVAMLVAIMAYRFVMGLLLALSLGLAAPLGFFTYAEITGMYEGQPASAIPDDELIPDQLRDPLKQIGKQLDEQAQHLLERTAEPDDETAAAEEQPAWRQRLDDTVKFIRETASQKWSDAPGAEKSLTVLFAAGGVIVGIVIGVLLPTLSASVVTSLAGSLIILTSGYWLLMRSGMSVDGYLPHSAATSLAWWLGTAVIGLLIQLRLGVKKADKG